jgi:hypothetical protein
MPVTGIARDELEDLLVDWPPMLTITDVADITCSSPRTVRRWLAQGILRGLAKPTGGLLVPKSALISFLCGDEDG